MSKEDQQSRVGTPESLDEKQRWQSAFLGTDLFGNKEYLVLLMLQDDPTKKVYTTLMTSDLEIRIDIPLEEQTPQEELERDTYLHSTFFGEVDKDPYRKFATDTFNKEKLLAFLNRHTAGMVNPNDVPDWFYDHFGLKHGNDYGSVRIGSHGGSTRRGYDFNATIEPIYRKGHSSLKSETPDYSLTKAQEFSQVVAASLPHMRVTPLAVETYLQDVQQTLRFLPRDWTS